MSNQLVERQENRVAAEVSPAAGAAVREPSGPPAPFLPEYVWTMESIAKKLEVTIEREARFRSRPRISNSEVDQKEKNDVDATGTCSDERPQEGGSRLVQSTSSASIRPEAAALLEGLVTKNSEQFCGFE